MTQPPNPYGSPQPPPSYGGPAHPPHGDPHRPPAGRTSYPAALGAAAVWGGILLVITMAVGFSTVGIDALNKLGYMIGLMLAPTLIASLPVWLITRRRSFSFGILILIALPFVVVLRALSAVGAS